MPDQLRDRVVAALGDTYEIEAEIGRGGMAVVYRARDVRLRRHVAIKVLPPDLAFREEVRTRFLREAQTSAQLNHPNIVPIFSVDERAGLVYFVMALVEGESLGARLARERRPPVADVIRILQEVGDALGYAHARGIVHRDIKPDNILLDAATGRAIVTDFGIARAAEGDSRLTVTGIAVGTPTYMSPEQALGERDVDGRSDQYSLAVVGYQMLTGEPPFAATNTPAMLLKHISEPPAPLSELRPDLPPGLIAAIERALAKKPSDRWATEYAFRDALIAENVQAPQRTAPESLRQSAAWKRQALPRASLPAPQRSANVPPQPPPPPLLRERSDSQRSRRQ
ncbi:MAG TPA: serine/threonine-protein kinase, partial [Gemmatimonadaceae bacterium]|nr:serine/threonine-protein kinase [Gemmatimonadaceae bacterium]